jgi:hypothetical protein
MGQSGMTLGLALYEDLGLLRQMWAGADDDEANALRTVATTLIYGHDTDVPLADVEAARRHGWRVARPDAWPSIFRKDRGRSMRAPLAWELELMEGCLRALPGFVERRRQDDPARDEVTVTTAKGPLTLGLAWVQDNESR